MLKSFSAACLIAAVTGSDWRHTSSLPRELYEIIDDLKPHHDHGDHHHQHHHDRYQHKSHDYKPLSFTKAPRTYRGLNFNFFDDYL